MSARLVALVLMLASAACFQPGNAPQCTVICASSVDCPGGLSCNAGSRCSVGGAMCGPDAGVDSSIDSPIDSPIDASVDAPPDAFSCAPNVTLGCADNQTSNVCNANGTGVNPVTCALGCNSSNGRCNNCLVGEATCGGAGELRRCVDGQTPTVEETCMLGCVSGSAGGTVGVHCAHIKPSFFSDVCNTRSAVPASTIAVSLTINTSTAAVCTGGVITQAGAPEICVIRAASFDFTTSAMVKVTGSRAVAFVADRDLRMSGLLDVSGDQQTNGPGGGRVSGDEASEDGGGGGAGYQTLGGRGGGPNGGSGGPVVSGALPMIFGGGQPAQTNPPFPIGGGGGGAALLVACTGTVTIDGTINAGGGGGGAGFDTFLGSGGVFASGAGGGSGGYVVFQGGQVILMPAARVYSNGGGGGSGTSVDNDYGNNGADGMASLTATAGVTGTGTGGNGGQGGIGTQGPQTGNTGFGLASHGGGGGSTGRFKIYTPTGIGPMNQAGQISPQFDSNGIVPTE